MTISTLKTLAAVVGLAVLGGAAQAALVDRGGGLIYDSTRNITWLADMNYAKTSGYSSTGYLSWQEANQWAADLVYAGYSDWRLPKSNPDDTSCSESSDPPGFPTQHFGKNCTGSELSGLFVADLGNKELESVLDQTGDTPEQIANLALFKNVAGADYYWSGTEYAPDTGSAWYFDTGLGDQYYLEKFTSFFALAVRDGDVAAAVPEPQTLALALIALGGLGAVGRRRPSAESACAGRETANGSAK